MIGILLYLFSKLSINCAIEISANIVTYGALYESVTFKVKNDYFQTNLAEDLKTARKITWVNNYGAEILSYDAQALEVFMKNYTERIRFNKEKLDLTIESIRFSDCGTWKLYLQNSNAESRLYIISFELEIFNEIKITSKPISEMNHSRMLVRCENDYTEYSKKCKIPSSISSMTVVTSNPRINEIIKRQNSSVGEESSYYFFNTWSIIFKFDEIISDLVIFCSINVLNDKINNQFFLSNNVHIKSKEIVVKAPIQKLLPKHVRFVYTNYTFKNVNENLMTICNSSFSNAKHILFEGILDKNDDLANITDSTEDLVLLLSSKLKKLELDGNSNEQKSMLNYTCLTFDTLQTKEYLVQAYITNVDTLYFNSYLSKDSPKLNKCKHCGTVILIVTLIVLMASLILFIFLFKYFKNKRTEKLSNKRSSNSTAQNKFYEELQRQFENPSVKKYTTEGSELKIFLA